MRLFYFLWIISMALTTRLEGFVKAIQADLNKYTYLVAERASNTIVSL